MGLQSKETHDFVKLLTSHQLALRGFIVSLMPGSPDVDDVLQDTNVVIWEKMATFKPGGNFRAWVFAIAINVVKTHLNKTRRNRSIEFNEVLAHLIADTWYQRETGELSAKETALNRCIRELAPSEQAIIDARYSTHTNLRALANATGRPAATIRVSLFRIREKLRKCVNRRLATGEGVTL